MLKKKCPGCAKKIERKFNYCPYCGLSFKAGNDDRDYGMLGRDDIGSHIRQDLGLPFGLNGLMNSMIKQIESQLENMDFGDEPSMPRNIKIRVARAPGVNQVIQKKAPEKKVEKMPEISEKEKERRMGLIKVDAESKIKRIGDTIIYEIDAPGIKSKDDVVLTELATGLEIRAYSKDKCYVKFIPLKVEVYEYDVKKEKVFVEIKS